MSWTIGASQFAAGLGISDLMSRQELWRSLQGCRTEAEVKSDDNEFKKEILAHGHGAEFRGVIAAECVTGKLFDDTGSDQQMMWWVDGDINWRATPDGRCPPSGLEVKCPIKPLYTEIPSQYLVQMQLCMTVSQKSEHFEDLTQYVFCAWKNCKSNVWLVQHSEELEKWMFEEIQPFLSDLRNNTKPKRFSKKANPRPVLPRDVVEIEPLLIETSNKEEC